MDVMMGIRIVVMAGPVGFEPTILGSEGPRLGPGSTTGPRIGGNLRYYYSLGMMFEICIRGIWKMCARHNSGNDGRGDFPSLTGVTRRVGLC